MYFDLYLFFYPAHILIKMQILGLYKICFVIMPTAAHKKQIFKKRQKLCFFEKYQNIWYSFFSWYVTL